MIEGKIECSNAPKGKVIKCLAELGKSFPIEFDGLAHDKRVLIFFKLHSVYAFKELIRRLKRIKGIRIEYLTNRGDWGEA